MVFVTCCAGFCCGRPIVPVADNLLISCELNEAPLVRFHQGRVW